jgi:hypothetical protein
MKSRLVEFIKDYKLDSKNTFSDVKIDDLIILKKEGYKTENLLDLLNNNYGSLFHGSTSLINDYLLPSHLTEEKSNQIGDKYAVFATPFSSIALLKAIFSNKDSSLIYNFHISKTKSLDFRIEDYSLDTIKEKGNVYVINETKGFENGAYYKNSNPKTYIEWFKKGKDPVIFQARIEVVKNDFRYPYRINDDNTLYYTFK